MRALTGELILNAWDRCQAEPDVSRPVALLAMALPDLSSAQLAAMPLAERNARLLELRAISFGPVMDGSAACPECGTRLEFTVAVDDLRSQITVPEAMEWEESERTLYMRPVNTRDLALSLRAMDATAARRILIASCMESSEEESAVSIAGRLPDESDRWPPDWLARFDALNASAEIRCALDCPECESRPSLDLDIADFLWRETSTAARRLLREVHQLASAYGWSEHDIMSLAPARRQAYLEMMIL